MMESQSYLERIRNRKIEPNDDPAAQSLDHVREGQLVWLHSKYGNVESKRLTTVTQAKKSRLWICRPDADAFYNWRYGFDVTTGRAHHYQGQRMSYASIDSIAEEEARVKAALNAGAEAIKQVQREGILKKYAAEMYGALLIVQGSTHIETANHLALSITSKIKSELEEIS